MTIKSSIRPMTRDEIVQELHLSLRRENRLVVLLVLQSTFIVADFGYHVLRAAGVL